MKNLSGRGLFFLKTCHKRFGFVSGPITVTGGPSYDQTCWVGGVDTVLQKIMCIAFGGALGALARYGMAGAVQKWAGSGFPWGTAAVNILGSFLFGMLWAFALGRGNLNADFRAVIFVGFLGSFTTFSTFISETGQFLADSQMLMGMGNVAFQLLVGTGVFFIGMALGRSI